jgi:hypothetical protein
LLGSWTPKRATYDQFLGRRCVGLPKLTGPRNRPRWSDLSAQGPLACRPEMGRRHGPTSRSGSEAGRDPRHDRTHDLFYTPCRPSIAPLLIGLRGEVWFSASAAPADPHRFNSCLPPTFALQLPRFRSMTISEASVANESPVSRSRTPVAPLAGPARGAASSARPDPSFRSLACVFPAPAAEW